MTSFNDAAGKMLPRLQQSYAEISRILSDCSDSDLIALIQECSTLSGILLTLQKSAFKELMSSQSEDEHLWYMYANFLKENGFATEKIFEAASNGIDLLKSTNRSLGALSRLYIRSALSLGHDNKAHHETIRILNREDATENFVAYLFEGIPGNYQTKYIAHLRNRKL